MVVAEATFNDHYPVIASVIISKPSASHEKSRHWRGLYQQACSRSTTRPTVWKRNYRWCVRIRLDSNTTRAGPGASSRVLDSPTPVYSYTGGRDMTDFFLGSIPPELQPDNLIFDRDAFHLAVMGQTPKSRTSNVGPALRYSRPGTGHIETSPIMHHRAGSYSWTDHSPTRDSTSLQLILCRTLVLASSSGEGGCLSLGCLGGTRCRPLEVMTFLTHTIPLIYVCYPLHTPSSDCSRIAQLNDDFPLLPAGIIPGPFKCAVTQRHLEAWY